MFEWQQGFIRSIKTYFGVIYMLKWSIASILFPAWSDKRKQYFWPGPLIRYVKLRVAHTPGMPGTFSPPLQVSDPDMQHGTCVTHVPWCLPGSLISGSLWSRWWGKRSRHSQRMHNTQFYVSGKRPIRNHQCSKGMTTEVVFGRLGRQDS